MSQVTKQGFSVAGDNKDGTFLTIPVGKLPDPMQPVYDLIDRITNPAPTTAPVSQAPVETNALMSKTSATSVAGVTRTDYLFNATSEPGLVEQKGISGETFIFLAIAFLIIF